MKNSILSSVKQAVISFRFLAGVLAVPLIVFAATINSVVFAVRTIDILPVGYHRSVLFQAVSSDAISFFVPILCTLPFSAAWIEDTRTNYIRYFVYRTKRPAYLLGRAAACWLSGGLVTAVGILLAYAVAAGVFIPMEKTPLPGMEPLHQFIQFLPCVLNVFLSGGLWALVGMMLSMLMESKYIAYASPFILFYLLEILYERYFPALHFIAPREWLVPTDVWAYGSREARLVVVGLTVVTALFFFSAGAERLRQL